MAVVLGTNSGFVTTAPTSDPGGFNQAVDYTYHVTGAGTSPSTAIKITEIGWWCDTATEASNFEVGLYADDGNNGKAGTLLQVERTNAKGTTSGWKTVSVDWAISGSTDYWIAIQLDNTSTTTNTVRADSGGIAFGGRGSRSTLDDPWPDAYLTFPFNGKMLAIYAVWEEAAPAGFTRKIKISGTFQDKPIKTKVAGTFEDKPIKIKVGGTFQDA